MTSLKPYRLMIKTLAKSKARFLKFIPIESFVEGEKFEVVFRVKNIGEEDFPKGVLRARIEWPSQQRTAFHGSIGPLKRNGPPQMVAKVLVDALSNGYGLIFIDKYEDLQGKSHVVEYYDENRVKYQHAISYIKFKTWEEIYGFQALIIAAISLAIIAIEKISTWLTSLIN